MHYSKENHLISSIVISSQHAVLQLIKDAVDQNGMAVRDDSPVTEVLNQVCPSSWRGACKTAVQLLFGQAGLVSFTSLTNAIKSGPQCSLFRKETGQETPPFTF